MGRLGIARSPTQAYGWEQGVGEELEKGKEVDAARQRTVPKSNTAASKKKTAGSDLSSAHGSEERHSSLPAAGRSQKRGRDFEIEKVGGDVFSFKQYFIITVPQNAAGLLKKTFRCDPQRAF